MGDQMLKDTIIYGLITGATAGITASITVIIISSLFGLQK